MKKQEQSRHLNHLIAILVLTVSMFTMMSCGKDKSITIAFETNGGNPVESMTIDSDQDFIIPEDPEKVGHTFIGWYMDQDTLVTPFTPNQLPEGDTIVYAKWDVNLYTITFVTNGGSAVGAMEVPYDSDITNLPVTEKQGYAFIGWMLNPSLVTPLSFDTMPAQDIVLYADFGYEIHFESQDGPTVSSQVVAPGSTLAIPETFWLGHTLEGWYTSLDGGLTLDEKWSFTSHVANSTLTLYANWILNVHGIHFDSNGGSAVDAIMTGYNTALTAPLDPVREGYVFMGWTRDLDTEIPYVFDLMPDESVYLTAIWHNTLTFNTHGASEIDPITLLAGTEIAEPETPIREGHTFMGWYADDAYAEEFVFSVMPNSNTTIHAKWEINTYTVTFDARGGSPLDEITLPYGSSLSNYDTALETDVFYGWFADDALTSQVMTVPAENMTLYAKWLIRDAYRTVGVSETVYTVPVSDIDSETSQVEGGYRIGDYEVTYAVWHLVKTWADANGYEFENPGREGSSGSVGLEPTLSNKLQPVTSINWWDAIIWTNALSEMKGLTPLYRHPDGSIIRISKNTTLYDHDLLILTEGGYRLPTLGEWKMAARWRHTGGDGSIMVGDRYWTPGNYASGATAPHTDREATNLVAWSNQNTSVTGKVGTLVPNDLFIHDMSGNVSEWCQDGFHDIDGKVFPYHLGGFFDSNPAYVRIGYIKDSYAYFNDNSFGFRLVESL